MEDERWFLRVKWAIYNLMGSLSISELMCNRTLVATFARLERLLKSENAKGESHQQKQRGGMS